MLTYFIHYKRAEVDDAIDHAVAIDILPTLRSLIREAAERIGTQPGFEQSPYAQELAAELIIKELAGFLALTSFDDRDTARPSMLETPFINWWFGLDKPEKAAANDKGLSS